MSKTKITKRKRCRKYNRKVNGNRYKRKTKSNKELSRLRSYYARTQNRNSNGTFAKGRKSSETIKCISKAGVVSKKQKISLSNNQKKRSNNTSSRSGINTSYKTKKELVKDVIPIKSEINKKDVDRVASVIADTFTRKEIELTEKPNNRVTITITNNLTKKTADGEYHRLYDDGKDNIAAIKIKPEADKMGITHEMVHHMRTIDKTRNGASRTPYELDKSNRRVSDNNSDDGPKINNLEECATSAEAAIRTGGISERPPTYFDNIKVKRGTNHIVHRNRHENYKFDREVLRKNKDGTNPRKDRDVTGKEAIGKMERNFEKSLISNKDTGSESARETLKKIEKKRGG